MGRDGSVIPKCPRFTQISDFLCSENAQLSIFDLCSGAFLGDVFR